MNDDPNNMDKKIFTPTPKFTQGDLIPNNSKSQNLYKQENVTKRAQSRPGSDIRKQPKKSFKPRSKEWINKEGHGPEVGSIQAPGSRKRDWDNLFFFSPRERGLSPSVWKSHHTHRGRHQSGGGGKNKFNKENFLRANCTFLVREGNDYAPYLADPDLLVDWECVEEIVVTMIDEGASCPICLEQPVAAKMTICGHIFCWSCILHYLALSDQTSRPCPICYESVSYKDLKSVETEIYYNVEQLEGIIDMELLKCHKDMRSVLPLHAHEATDEWNKLYSKIRVISSAEVMEKVLGREQKELTACFEKDPNCPEVCFIHQALEELEKRKEKLLLTGLAYSLIESGNGAKSNNQETLEISAGDNNNDTTIERNEYHYFYQDCKGLNSFLHPLNFAMLTKEFGSDMDSWPRYLSFRIIDKEYYSANEDTRKRWKFLRHLPLSTPFVVVEVDLSEFVGSEVMEEFNEKIEYRKQRREQRVKDEKKMEKVIAERERKIWNIAAVPKFEPKLDFPDFLETAGPALCELSPATPTISEAPGSSSFAKIAGKAPVPMKKSPTFPIENSPSLRKNLSDSPLVYNRNRERNADSEPESEDYVAIPEFRASISDAISEAMKNLKLEKPEDADETENVNNNGQRKKKKNKGKVLFATGGMGSFN